MAEVEIVAQPAPVVEIVAEGGLAVEVQASAPARVDVLTEGTQGIQGLPAAPPFTDTFAAAPAWTVNHNLGRAPSSVRVLTPGGIEVEATVTETSLNQLVISFASAQAGRVIVF